MQSDPSSSSPKRCVSECPSHDSGVRPPPGDLPQPPSLSDDRDHDIDAYMAEQEGALQLGASALAPFPVQNGIVAAVSPEAKLSLVQNLSKKQMQVGDTWYLVSRQWYKRWQKACSGELDKEGPLEEKDVGPVNNSSLVDKDGNLVYAVEGIDVEYVPQEAWSYLVSWFVHSPTKSHPLSYDHPPLSRYGEPVHTLPRKVIARGIAQEPSLEIHPPRFRALVLSDDLSSDAITGPPPPVISLSSKDSVRTLFRHLANAFPSNAGYPFRIWRVDLGDVEGSIFPSSKLSAHNGVEVIESDLSVEEDDMRPGSTFVVEFKKGSEWTVSLPQSDATSVIKVDVPPPLFASGSNDFSQNSKSPSSSKQKSSPAILNQVVSKVMSTSSGIMSTSFLGSSGFGGSHSYSKPQQPGTLGLGNMYVRLRHHFYEFLIDVTRGNTCFMNSALQCLVHTPELAEYFLSTSQPIIICSSISDRTKSVFRHFFSGSIPG